jgi:hypothetical protein
MATAALKTGIGRIFVEPLRGPPLVMCGLLVWFAGAAYCHGYERLLSGADEWEGSLIWSAIAVLPWFALFEWSKQPRGAEATRRPWTLVALVLGIAALSIVLEYLINWSLGDLSDRVALLVMRRLPAIAATLMLIALAKKVASQRPLSSQAVTLSSIADMIDYLAAADNYVELHIGGRVTMRRMTMAEAERALAGCGFVRIHRRYLVNRKRVGGVVGNGDRRVRLSSGIELPVGRRFAPNLDRPS